MLSRPLATALVLLVGMGCSPPHKDDEVEVAAGNDAGVDAGTDGGAIDAGFQPASHEALPIIPRGSGPVLAAARLVTVTFTGYPFAHDVQQFGDWLLQSQWLSSTCAEYGCGVASHTSYVIDETPPASVGRTDIEAMLEREVSGGALPTPDADTLFVVYYPAATEVDPVPGAAGCASGAYFHFSTHIGSTRAAYAVIPDCSASPAVRAMFGQLSALELIEESASHEILEALTDPFYPAEPGFLLADPNEPWSSLGGEVADWCVGLTAREQGRALTRAWSNHEAAAGRDPCVPAAGAAYFNASPVDGNIYRVAVGGQGQLMISGWSTGPIDRWSLRIFTPPPMPGGFDAKPRLSASALGNGDTVTASVSVPSSAAPGSRALLLLASSNGTEPWFHVWPVFIEAR